MDLKTYLPYDILVKVDIASMMNGLEVRTPFIDLKVLELAATIPEHFHIGKDAGGERVRKQLVKKVAERYFPRQFVHRPKMGFAVPLEKWFAPGGELHRYLQERLMGKHSTLHDFFHPAAISEIIHSGETGPKWLLLVAEEWLRQNPAGEYNGVKARQEAGLQARSQAKTADVVKPGEGSAGYGSRRAKILLIADVPNWIFERHCLMLQKYLSQHFDFTIIYDDQHYDENDFDLIYPLEWYKVKPEQIQEPLKYVSGIRSHLVWTDYCFSDVLTLLGSRYNLVHVVSKRLYEIFAPHLSNVRYVSHGADTSLFTPTTTCDQSGVGLRLGWAGNRKSGGKKGFAEFIEPLGRVPGVELVFCGYSDRNLPVTEMQIFYDSLDAYVCASESEGNNNSLMEAAAMARVIITTDNGTVPEYLEHERSALIVARDLCSFIRCVIDLRDNPAKRRRLGDEARKAVLRHWKWEDRAEDYRRFFVEALERRAQANRRGEAAKGKVLIACNALSFSATGSESVAGGAKRMVPSMGLDTRASSGGGGGSPLLPGATTDAGTGASPLVSVIVPTHNRPNGLKEALRSILDQTFQDFQIIVVNDAGADVSSIVKGFGDGRILYLCHENNKGLAAARNTGIRASRGKYIAYLDDDDVYYADHLETLVTFMKSGGEKVAYTDAYRAHQALQPDGSYLISKRDLPYSHDFDYRQILVGNFIPVLCIMHEASCLEETGCYDEELAAHEDWDLWIRLSRKFSFHHIKKVTSEFRWREDGTSMTSSKELDFITTQEAIYRKYSHLCKEMPEVREVQKSSLLGRKKAAESMAGVCCTIIIPVFNQLQYTSRCLDVLYSVTPFRCRFEVVVVDNASTDGTASYLQQAARLYPNLRFIRNEQNLLFAGACNMGAKAARGELLVFLNNDTEPEPQWLEQLLAPLHCDAVGLVGAKLLYPDRTVQHGGMVFVACAPVPEEIFAIHRFRGTAEDDERINNPEELPLVTGACIAIRKELFNAVGGISTEYGMYYEDVDLCLKVRKAGKIVFYQPRSVLIHHENKSSASTEAAQELDAQARRVFLKKWRGELVKMIQGNQNVFAEGSAALPEMPSTPHQRTKAFTEPKPARKILWIRPDSIGDNVLAAAMLPYLKSAAPDARVTVVCQQHVAELYESSPYTDAVISFEKLRTFQDESYRKAVVSRIRSERADLALDPVYSRDAFSDLFTIESGAAERVGFQGNLCNITRQLRDDNNRGYTTLLQSEGEWKPELERHRDFLRGMGVNAPPLQPVIWTTPEDEEVADRFFRETGWRPDRCLVLFAGAQAGERRYPHYGRALAPICREGGFRVVAVGTAEEFALNQENLDDCAAPAVNLSGKLSLRQTAALLKRCRLAVGAETGTAHIACAVGTPNVVLVGGGHFSRFMPYSPLTSVVCLPLACYCCNWRCSYKRAHCVKDLHPEVIAAAVRQTLSGPCDRIRVFCESRDSWLPMPGEPQWKGCENLLVHYPVQVFYRGIASRREESALGSMTVEGASSIAAIQQ